MSHLSASTPNPNRISAINANTNPNTNTNTTPNPNPTHLLQTLNPSQRAAVTSPATQVAILAGPGSGKTHTLTTRVAWLLQQEGLKPWNVIVATFTVKAAREMGERIGRLVGGGAAGNSNGEGSGGTHKGSERKIILGTFHSIARRYLVRYGHLIGVKKGFGIADAGDSLAIIKRIVKRLNLTIEPAMVRGRISRRKAKGGEEDEESENRHKMVRKNQSAAKSEEAQEFEICFTEYEEALQRSNLLDYDDLLLRCVDLLRQHPSCVQNVEAVLIDEFQDTNTVQFDLMRLFATYRKRVTIVGDPDQSIYGFRSAETKNFKRMLRQYPDTVTIPLEENYRSSGSILMAALEVIQQDESRIAKSLMPTHSVGTRPVLRKLISAPVEAQWIVSEIKRCLTLTGGLMSYDDIAILLRSANLSRHIESALGKAGISYRMVGGHKFYDRVEVKILLDYLRTIHQPDNNDALARVINIPSRKIGEVTVKSLLEEADQSSVTLWTLILDCVQGRKNTLTKLSAQCERGLSSFVNIVLTGRKKLEDPGAKPSIVDLMEYVIKKISFEEYLEKTYTEEFEARWANVQELMNLASDFSETLSDQLDEDALPELERLPQSTDTDTPLSKFLANVSLAADVKAADAAAAAADSSNPAQVTISTIHAAKGLEWPVVFIPSVYDGSIPHSRAEDADEERRLLYVAMTRAKALLYLSFPVKNSKKEYTTLSPFLSAQGLKPHFAEKGPSFKAGVVQSVAMILSRSLSSGGGVDVNVAFALQVLGSLEDDAWPADPDPALDDDEEKWKEWEWDGKRHHFTQGQEAPPPLKRRRVEGDGLAAGHHHHASENHNQAQNQNQQQYSSYATTMSRAATFTTASTTLNPSTTGFVSAGSHMQVLKEKAVGCLAETVRSAATAEYRSRERMGRAVSASVSSSSSASASSSSASASASAAGAGGYGDAQGRSSSFSAVGGAGGNGRGNTGGDGRKTKARTTKRPEGQGSLLNYFGKPNSASAATAGDAAAHQPQSKISTPTDANDRWAKHARPESRSREIGERATHPVSNFKPPAPAPIPPPPSTTALQTNEFLLPALSNHRLGSGSLKITHLAQSRQQRVIEGSSTVAAGENAVKKKAYLQFSSSPPPARPVVGSEIEVEGEMEREVLVREAEAENLDMDGYVPPFDEKQVDGEEKGNEKETDGGATEGQAQAQPQTQSRPAKTLHVTSVQRINTLSAPPPPLTTMRKTLGVRRSMNGWSMRGGRGGG